MTVRPSGSLESFNSATQLKLGPAPMTDKLREQVVRTIQDESTGINGDHSPRKSTGSLPNGQTNGHTDTNGDVDMDARDKRSPTIQEVKLEPDIERDRDLISPGENETHPPVPAVFRIADLKREVEAVKDKRKMIRLGPGVEDGKTGGPSSAVLPSVVAFTLFDNDEG